MSILDFIKNLFKSNKKVARLITQDLTKVKGESEPLEVGLYENKTPLVDKDVNISINGVKYNRKTDNDGIARLNINLPVGEYDSHITFEDSEYEYASTYCKVTINPMLITQDLTMVEKDGNKFNAYVQSDKGDKLSNIKVTFSINGKNYERTSDENGVASLNINLKAGDYEIKTSCVGVTRENTIHISNQPPKKTWMEGTDIDKIYCESTPYQCAVYSDEGRISGTVNITLNGVTYRRTPDSEGLYKLNINLMPGTYALKAEFVGNNKYEPSNVENTVNIKEKPAPQPKSYEEELLEYFESVFGEVSCFDDALEKVEDHGYAYYYDNQYSNRESINRMANWLGINCTDSCQVFYNIAKALGYDVQLLHIGCSGGDGHVRLRLRRNGGDWFYRDPAAVLEDNGQGITYNWCMSGSLWAIDPSWFFEDLYW